MGEEPGLEGDDWGLGFNPSSGTPITCGLEEAPSLSRPLVPHPLNEGVIPDEFTGAH